jgi:hypothetical protein
MTVSTSLPLDKVLHQQIQLFLLAKLLLVFESGHSFVIFLVEPERVVFMSLRALKQICSQLLAISHTLVCGYWRVVREAWYVLVIVAPSSMGGGLGAQNTLIVGYIQPLLGMTRVNPETLFCAVGRFGGWWHFRDLN